MRHEYKLSVKWTGSQGVGTVDYKAYDRSLTISSDGKPDILGSTDPAYRGDPAKWNPEELLLSSLSSCHMLWYLHLCAVNKIVVVDYQDTPTAVMETEKSGAGKFTSAAINPSIVITDPSRIEDAINIHKEAHQKCFIAQSVNFPVEINPEIKAK